MEKTQTCSSGNSIADPENPENYSSDSADSELMPALQAIAHSTLYDLITANPSQSARTQNSMDLLSGEWSLKSESSIH